MARLLPLPRLAALALLALWLAGPGCAHRPDQGPDPEPRPAVGEGARLLMDLDAAWAATLPAGDREAFLARVAPDALFASARVLSGREEVWSSWRRFFEKGGPTLQWTPTAGGMAPSGDLGWTVGSFRFEARPPSGDPLVSEGRYATVWSRGGEGPWLVALDGGLEAPGASAGAPRRVLRTLASRDGSLEASLGTWERAGPDAAGRGAWLSVRQRSADGWSVVVESELAFPPARP